MLFQISLYLALGIFAFGMGYRVFTWLSRDLGPPEKRISTPRRAAIALRGTLKTLFSGRLLIVMRVLLLDVLLQKKLWTESRLRWSAHISIFAGFMLLLVMHALENFFSVPLFSNYSSTLNPFLFLRNLFFLAVLAGLALAYYRRRKRKAARFTSNSADSLLVLLLALVMISGVLLEGVKIISHGEYQRMVEEYSDTDDSEELQALEAYWVTHYGVVSPDLRGPFEAEQLAAGSEIHEMSCAACHSRPQWAFMSYGVSRAAAPLAALLERVNAVELLYTLHFLVSFIGLAYLPFSKMLHVFTSPLSLINNAVMDSESADPANVATRQMLELDACTHCGACTEACTVGAAVEEIDNQCILPSEKISHLKTLAAGGVLEERQRRRLLEGLLLCTNCHHCTDVCPVGINLQQLWFNARESMLAQDSREPLLLSPFSHYRGLCFVGVRNGGQAERPLQVLKEALNRSFKSMDAYGKTIELGKVDREIRKVLQHSLRSNSFSTCFTCKTCSLACPVVENYDNPRERLGLLPHQIIRAAVLGVGEPIFRSNMLWDCLGCYECQENCPQNVHVAEILYELKNVAVKNLNAEGGSLKG